MKQNIFHFYVISLFVPTFFLSCSEKTIEPNEISLKEAEQIVFYDILNNNDSGKVIYELLTKLESNTKVKQRGPDSTKYSVPYNAWFFFIDDQPDYRWAHACRYVFIACEGGRQTIFNERFPPENFENLRVVIFK